AVDTAGNYPWPLLEGLLPLVDLVLYDIKVLDPDLHRRVIGSDGARIRANLERLGQSGRPFAVRTPLVGGVNDTEAEIGGIARLIGRHPNLQFYELLPYHALGDAKLESLGLGQRHPFHAPGKDRVRALAETARAFVADVRP
ncbi:MAG: glycyl-radical enzyme activating protein, partial [Gemmatimonadota bacterium]